MDKQLKHAILQSYPHAARIISLRSFRPGYLPYPARLTVQTTTGDTAVCVLKVGEDAATLNHEARVLRALTDLQLSVPQVLADPITIPAAPEPLTILLISKLPGTGLPWISLNNLSTADRTCKLVIEAVDRLHALTPAVMAHPIAALLPSKTLDAEAQAIRTRHSAWLEVSFFRDALRLVEAAVPRYPSPLVFSNGDYNPLNFLVEDHALSGWIDFEYACFEDPYIGFAKFLLWADDEVGWAAGAKAGLVERFLYWHGVLPAAFLVRLLLRGLTHLQDTSPTNPPAYMLHVITDAAHRLRHTLDT